MYIQLQSLRLSLKKLVTRIEGGHRRTVCYQGFSLRMLVAIKLLL